MPALANHFHVVAPDYPGFGNSEFPSPDEFNYTFDRLSEVTEDFLKGHKLYTFWALHAGLWWTGWIPNHNSAS